MYVLLFLSFYSLETTTTGMISFLLLLLLSKYKIFLIERRKVEFHRTLSP